MTAAEKQFLKETKKALEKKLETHRFVLSENPELRKQLREFRDKFREFKKEHPEVAGCTVFGSMVKGYATPKSDLDLILYLDADKFPKGSEDYIIAKDEEKKVLQNLSLNRLIKISSLHGKYKRLLEEKTKEIDLPRYDLLTVLISKKIVKESVKRLLRARDRLPDLFFSQIFGLNLDPEIKKYRELAINEIERQCKEQGKDPDALWKHFAESLSQQEGIVTHKVILSGRPSELYPQTIQEAREKFCK